MYRVSYNGKEIWRGLAESRAHAMTMAWALSWHEYPEKDKYIISPIKYFRAQLSSETVNAKN